METSMSTRSSFLALAAITALGVAALAPTSASALGGHGFGRGHVGHVGGGMGHGRIGIRPIHRPIALPHLRPHWRWHWRSRYVRFGVPVVGATVIGAAYATTPARPACTCLTKEYLPDGSLLFKDLCTNEAAMAPANSQAQAPVQAP
jgi:hypothetical protein